MTAYDLVIFDCDGVLVDSEPISNRLLAEALTAIGVPTTAEQSMERYMGGSLAAVLADVEARLGRPAPDDFVGRFRAARPRTPRERLARHGVVASARWPSGRRCSGPPNCGG